MTRLECAVAWRYLRSRRGSRLLSLISVIAIGGVLIGVSALIVVMGVMNGLQRDLRDKILIGSADVRVLPYGNAMRMGGWRAVREQVRATRGVVAASPFVTTEGLVINDAGYRTGVQVVGIDSPSANDVDVTTIRAHAIVGDFTFTREGSSLPGAVLGKTLAAKLNAFPGDTLRLAGDAGLQVNQSTGVVIPRLDSVVVAGLFETGMYEYDDHYLYVSLSMAQRFAGLGDDVTGIEARTTDRWKAAEVADTLRATLSSPVRAEDWQETNRTLFSALKLEKFGMGIILLLIVVVAAFNIVGTLTMVVADKTREIGILRAMGMPARSIRRIFLMQGAVIGAVGTVGGLLLGLSVTLVLDRYRLIPLDPSIYFIDHLPVATQLLDVATIAAASLAVSTLATVYPARLAARMYPVDAIRHD